MDHSSSSNSQDKHESPEKEGDGARDVDKSSEIENSTSKDQEHVPNADGTNGLRANSWPFGAGRIEPVSTYGKGGNLPVHIGSLIDRYRVVHKLHPSYASNTWLCIDTKVEEPKYYAIKAMKANAPKTNPELWIGNLFKSINADPPPVNLALPYQILGVDSANGSHDIIVTPFIGPRISHLFSLRAYPKGEAILRKMCHQITHALTVLHDCNLCHGEVEPIHVLAQVHGLNGRSEQAVLKDIGRQKIDRVLNEDSGEQAHVTFAPLYLVYQVDWDEMEGDTIDITNKAYLSFFEKAFKAGDSPESLTIAMNYCAPEWILHGKGREPSDIWSLACTLFEIRTGVPLFDSTEHNFNYLLSVTLMIGAMPEKWLEKWPNHKKLFEDKPDENGRVVAKEGIKLPKWPYRSVREAAEACYKYVDMSNPTGTRSIPRELETEEVDLFADLLGKMLKWEPEERIKKDELLAHPWFSFEKAGADEEKDEETDEDFTDEESTDEELKDEDKKDEKSKDEGLKDEGLKDEGLKDEELKGEKSKDGELEDSQPTSGEVRDKKQV